MKLQRKIFDELVVDSIVYTHNQVDISDRIHEQIMGIFMSPMRYSYAQSLLAEETLS